MNKSMESKGIHIFLNLIMSFAKDFSLLEMLKDRRRQKLRSLQKRKYMALHWSQGKGCKLPKLKHRRIFQKIWLISPQKVGYSMREISKVKEAALVMARECLHQPI
jgi:hypothetical protein